MKKEMLRAILLRAISNAPLEKLEDVFRILSRRVHTHRQANRGFVPREIFPFCIGIGGIYPCVEIVVKAHDGKSLGFALKKRSGNEQGWKGKYQIVGAAVRTTDKPENVYNRVLAEIFGEGKQPPNLRQSKKLEFIGTEIHDEPERQAVCLTLVWQIKMMKKDLAGLDGEWRFFKNPNDKRIVNHHQKTLAWVSDENREIFVDLR